MARALALVLTVLAFAAGAAQAQQAQQEQPAAPARGVGVATPILTLDQVRVYSGSLWGKRVEAQIASELAALAAESTGISDKLTVEERDLTDRRPSMTPEVFRVEADAFDARVTAIRREQDAKSKDIAKRAEVERLAYFDAILGILGDVLRQRGAVAIVNRAAILVAADAIDVTDAVIAEADAVLGAGPAPAAPGAPVAPGPADPVVAPAAGGGN